MLHFVLGTTGVSKTEYLYDYFCKLANDGDKKLMFIVPDQYSFNTEKAFLELLGPMLSRNIKVFGFSRLCDYVFEQTGNRFMNFADEGVRNVVMNVAIEQVCDQLDLFSKRATATDLTTLMLNSIKEYKKCSKDKTCSEELTKEYKACVPERTCNDVVKEYNKCSKDKTCSEELIKEYKACVKERTCDDVVKEYNKCSKDKTCSNDLTKEYQACIEDLTCDEVFEEYNK